jgi:hypothetical protein
MIFRRCALAAALMIALPQIALADICIMVPDITKRIAEEIPGARISIAEGPTADRITTGISSAIGEEVPPGGIYVLADLQVEPLTYIVRFVAGCATHHGRFPRQLVHIWIEGQIAEAREHD